MAEVMTPAPTTFTLPSEVSRSRVAKSVDPWLVMATVALLSIGTVLVFSASAVRSYGESGAFGGYLFRHVISIFIGLIGLSVAVRTPVEKWSRHAYLLLGLTILLLCLVYVPGLGRRVNGAVRWLAIGPARFQPAELAKLAVVVYLAHSLAKKREKVRSFSVGFLPHVGVASFVVLLIIAQPDFGTSVIIFAILGSMMFIAGTKIGYLLACLLGAMPLALLYVASRPHAMARLTVFLNPEAHKTDIGYQIWESLVSFGSGGFSGIGLGAGRQKLYFLPEAHTDFIFAVVGEELGFLGAVLILGLFAVLVGRGLRLAFAARYRFQMYLAFGISAWLGVQALTNMAVVVALVPTKGLTLPLLSYGGSSQIVTLTAIGILLRISAEQVWQKKGERV